MRVTRTLPPEEAAEAPPASEGRFPAAEAEEEEVAVGQKVVEMRRAT